MAAVQREKINEFLVDAFNTILQYEERALAAGEFTDLSVKEYHVIEAAVTGESATMSTVSKKLGVTVGTLTVAVKTLEKKGYLLRTKSLDDKRMVYLQATERGMLANDYHGTFHHKMVDAVTEIMPEEQLASLTTALGLISDFFSSTTTNI